MGLILSVPSGSIDYINLHIVRSDLILIFSVLITILKLVIIFKVRATYIKFILLVLLYLQIKLTELT